MLVQRLEVRRYISRFAKEPVRISLTEQECARQPPLLPQPAADGSDAAAVLVMSLSLFNARRESDWRYYFGDAPPKEIR